MVPPQNLADCLAQSRCSVNAGWLISFLLCAQPQPGADESEDAALGVGDAFLSSSATSFYSFGAHLKFHLAQETSKEVLNPTATQRQPS